MQEVIEVVMTLTAFAVFMPVEIENSQRKE